MDSTEYKTNDPFITIEKLTKSMEIGEQCHMKGKIILYKGTGKVLFTFNTKAFIIDDLRRTNPEVGNKINLNHKLKSLTFGEVAQHIHILLRFGASDHTNFDMVKMVDDDIYANDE